jgi:hypothetical protein
MQSKIPTIDAAARFLADLRANTTRTADQRDDPAWHAMPLVAFELLGEVRRPARHHGCKACRSIARGSRPRPR